MDLSGGRAFGKTDLLTRSPFVQSWDDLRDNPPPPGTDVRITDDFNIRITNAGDRRITD